MKGKDMVLRPLAIFTFTYFIISCSLFTADTSIRFGFAVIFSVLYVFALAVKFIVKGLRKRNYRTAIYRAVLFFLAGGALASCLAVYNFDIQYKKYSTLYGETTKIKGVVTDVVWDGGNSGIYKVRVDEAGEHSDFFCVLTGNGGIQVNERIECTAEFSPLSSDGAFDEYRYYLTKKTVIAAESYNITPVGDAGPSFNYAAYRVNSFLSDIFVDYMGEDEGGFAAALLFGNKEYLSKTLNRDFTRLGVSHALAISGMHLTVICAFIATMLRPFGKRTVQWVCTATIVFYMFITGLAPAVTRSGVMFLVYMAAHFLARGGDRYTNLGFSVFFICLVDTYACGDIGLQLSFGAVLAIFLFAEKKKETQRPVVKKEDEKSGSRLIRIAISSARSLWDAVLLTVIILIFMLPIEWLYFGSICILAPLVSPLFSFLTSLLLWALPLFLIISPIKPVASFFAVSLKYLIRLTEYLANVFSRMSNITFHLEVPFGEVLVYLIFAVTLLFCVTKKKARYAALSALSLLICAFVTVSVLYTSRFDDKVYLSMLTYKSNDGIFLATDKKAMVIDMANGYSGILGEGLEHTSVIPASEIEAVVLTHLHNTTAATVKSFILKNTVRRVYVPKEESSNFDAVMKIAKKYGSEAVSYDYGDVILFGDSEIKICEPSYLKRSVQPSLRVEICAYNERFIYLGGGYCEAEGVNSFCEGDTVWFGVHGPKYKKSFSVSGNAQIFASEDAIPYIRTEGEINDPADIILGNS